MSEELTAREKKLIQIVYDFCRKSVPETLLPIWGKNNAVIYTPKNIYGICLERLPPQPKEHEDE